MAEEKKELEKDLEDEIAPEEKNISETKDDTVEVHEEDAPEDKTEENGKESKKRTNRKKDKNLIKLEEKLADLEDKRMRQLAEFENFRKRSEKEKSQMFEIGAKTVIEKILPVIDNFERGLLAIPEEENDTPFVQGMELVYKQLLTALEELGVQAIDAVGAEFDPNLHNAVMMVEDEEAESGTVAEEMQKGYLYKETVVRHSMVKVVQ